jgi:hypothetical protein
VPLRPLNTKNSGTQNLSIDDHDFQSNIYASWVRSVIINGGETIETVVCSIQIVPLAGFLEGDAFIIFHQLFQMICSRLHLDKKFPKLN